MNHREILELEREQDFRDRCEATRRAEFIEAALAGDMTAEAKFAPMVNDYSKPAGEYGRERRYPTVGEIMDDHMGFADGTRIYDAFSLICRAAKGEDIRADAMKLIRRAADEFVRYAEGLE